MFRDRKIILAVCGSIAAYRAAEICRFLTKSGATVTVLMTGSAQRFIGAATFEGLTGRPPVTELFGGGFTHLQAGGGGDLLVIAPATANIMAKLAAGIADDIVTATVLASDCPVMICPAMNEKMWFAKATQRNVRNLATLGYEIIGPAMGDLACGERGWGRLEDLADIEAAIANRVRHHAQLSDKHILVTAGPTREYMDPVRFLSNPSSGKTGFGVAEEAARRGGSTTLISGPTALTPSRRLDFIPIETAEELRLAVDQRYSRADAVVMTAAVADHRFERSVEYKIDKDRLPESLTLIRNPDILAELGRTKAKQVLIGFAAQTDDLIGHGLEKLTAKNLDLIVATKVGRGRGFGEDTIEATLVGRDTIRELGLVEKKELAVAVVDALATMLFAPAGT